VRSRLDPVIRDAGRDREFLRHLGHRAVATRPPSGFLKAGVVEARGTSVVTLDVKRVGISAITNLARIYAYQAGIIDENRTVRRLRGARQNGVLTAEVAEGLEEAFRLLFQVRIEHQAQRARGGAPPDDEVDPRDLGPLTRQGLREAFRMIEQAQRSLAAELGLRA
jgi:CBS domain-containing protein